MRSGCGIGSPIHGAILWRGTHTHPTRSRSRAGTPSDSERVAYSRWGGCPMIEAMAGPEEFEGAHIRAESLLGVQFSFRETASHAYNTKSPRSANPFRETTHNARAGGRPSVPSEVVVAR